MLRVPVLSKSGKPLMPSLPSRARRWLRDGKAKVVHNDLECFAIQLTFETGEETQPIAVGIDPGKRYSGVGVQSGSVTLWMGHLVLPFKTVKERMELRRIMRLCRRGRRINRKLPYSERCHRQKRFNNRKQAKLPPSIRANKQLELRVVKELFRLFPISTIHYELVMADVDRTSGRKSARRSVGFSPVMVGQRQMLNWLSELAPVITHQGWQRDGNGTSQLRQWLGLAKDKKNKDQQTPATHAVDGVTLAAFEFIQWREWHSDNAKHGGWCGNVQVTPAPFAIIRRPPISRRQLHLCVPSKGGKRRKYGGTVTRHGFRKGDKVIAEKAGKTYIGWCSGDTEKQVSVSDVNWKRLGQFTVKKVQLLQRSTGLIVRRQAKSKCRAFTWIVKSPLIERVDLTAIPLHPASLRVESHANTMSTTAVNPFLAGNFAPVQDEITADELTVIGELPADLSGMFVRNSPNPQFPPIGHYHWFDGDGMLHGVQISNGTASYRDRYVRTPGFEKEREAGHAIWTGLMEPPKDENSSPSFKNVANTSVIWHAGHFLALWEGGEPYAIKLPELETIGAYTFEGKLASPFTAHPKIDAVTGEMMFFGYSPMQPPFLTYSIVSRSGELVRTVPIDLPEPVMMHDFAITQDYTLFMDLPMVFNPQGEAMIQFKSERPSRFGIVPRHGDNSSIRWFESPSCFVFHTLNAYQEGDEVVLIACRMNSTTVLTSSEETGGEAGANEARLYQWRFNLRTGKVQEKPLDERISDFPRINEQLIGRKMRYGYTAKMADNPMPLFEGVIKYDFDNGTSQVHHYGAGRYGGEAVFAPRPNGTAEDDGWLVTFVHDENSDTSELVVLNAQDLTAEPVARVVMPQRVPYGFHGTWVSQDQLIHSI